MSIQVALAGIFTILPIVLLLCYFTTRDRRREPRAALVRTFLLGVLVTIPAIPLSLGLRAVLPLFSPGPLLAALYHAFVVAAIPEELLKLSVVALYCARRVSFDEPMDGVVYGATAALGFAALENVLYVVGGGLAVALARSVTAVPMHAIMGAILGHYIARSRFLLEGRRLDIWKGWAIATLVHGLYDFGPMAILRLAEEETPLAGRGLLFVAFLLLFLGVVITSGLSMRRLVRRLRTEQLEVQLCAREEDSATAVPLGSPEAPQARGADVDRPGSSCLAEKIDPAPRDGRRQAP